MVAKYASEKNSEKPRSSGAPTCKRSLRMRTRGATGVKTSLRGPGLDLDELGPEWVFGGWLEGEEAWCLAAYRFAGPRE